MKMTFWFVPVAISKEKIANPLVRTGLGIRIAKKGDFTIKPAYDFDNKINDTNDDEESFFCGQCKKDFDNSRDYRAHQRIGCDKVTGSETPKKSVKTQDVTSSDDQQKDANKKLDLESENTDSAAQPNQSDNIEVFKCEACNFETKYSFNLTQHYKTLKHLKLASIYETKAVTEEDSAELEKNNLDDGNGETTLDKENLLEENTSDPIDFHSVECKLCDYKTRTPQGLKRHHTMIHDENWQHPSANTVKKVVNTAGETAINYKCDSCMFIGVSSKSLKIHKTMKHGRRKSKSDSTDQLIGEEETVTVKEEVIEEENETETDGLVFKTRDAIKFDQNVLADQKESVDTDYYMEPNAKRSRYMMDDLDDVNDGMDIEVIGEIVDESEEEDEDDTLEMFDSIVNDIQVKPSTPTVMNQRTAPLIDSSAPTLSASLTFAIEKIDFHKTTEESSTSPIDDISDDDHIEEPETNTGTNPETTPETNPKTNPETNPETNPKTNSETNPASRKEDELSLNLEDIDDDDHEENDVQMDDLENQTENKLLSLTKSLVFVPKSPPITNIDKVAGIKSSGATVDVSAEEHFFCQLCDYHTDNPAIFDYHQSQSEHKKRQKDFNSLLKEKKQ